jgi:predicted permease
VALALDAGTTRGAVGGGLAFGLVAAVAFALGPALRHSREGGVTDLKHQLGGDAPAARRWLRYPLVTAQIALSLALLVAAGLFIRFARAGTAIEVADAEETVIADVDASLGGYDETRGMAVYAAVEERLRALPDVEAASLGVTIPFGAVRFGQGVRRAGTRPAAGSRPATPAEGQSVNATSNAVGAQYFRAMGVTLLRGRPFTDGETLRPGSPKVAIVDEALARKLWPAGDALGQSVHIGDDETTPGAPPPAAVEIVGIVTPIRDDLFAKEPRGTIYVPFAQHYRSSVYMHARPRPGAASGFADRVRAAIRETAPSLPTFAVTTFGAHLRTSLEFWGLRALASVATSVGLFAAVIAIVGVYGAKAYAVTRRAREIGVRLAVGASPAGVRGMILGEALRVGGIGVGLGSLLGLGVGRAMASVFVDLRPFDLGVSLLTAGLLLLACAVAAWVPALRASRLDPSVVLRGD